MKFVVSAVSTLALCLTSLPAFAAPPTRSTAPPTGGPELSGDEAGIGSNVCKKWPSDKKFTITVPREAELEALVQWMMSISCQKFIWNAKIRSGKVTILSPESVSLREAYAAFYAAIESMGLTVEPAGDYFKIVESTDAKSLNLPVYGDGSAVPNNDRFVTQLVRVDNGNVKDISDVANKLKGKQGSVETVGNLLIITDRGSVVRRLLKIITELDVAGGANGEKIFFYQMQYADAEEVAQIIRDVFGEASGSGKGGKNAKAAAAAAGQGADFSRVIVDERTGTLIITTTAGDYATILRLIQQLDVRLPGGGGRIHVKQLRNADPQELATVLQNLTQGGTGGGATQTRNKGAAPDGAASAELFSGEVKITADEATRSLVIIASAADYNNLESVIDELDRDRKQVYLEIYLLEASVGRTLTTGASAHFGAPFATPGGDAVGLVTSAPSPDVNTLLIDPTALQGIAGGVLGPLIPGSGQLLGTPNDIPAFGVILQALQSNEDVNVVAEPHIYTADNKEAQIEVGRKVPTPGALQFGPPGGAGTSLTPLQSINREDVTLDIKVTPHVKDDTSLTLDIELEDRDVVSQDPILGVTTTKRRIKLENVLARDDLPVVLGGLMRERELINTQQVPGLGSIPIIGWMFKRRVKEKEKVNLLIILIPHVVETADEIRRIHERRTRERYEFLERETSFKRRDLATNVNYRKKAGLLANMDREARRFEATELLLREAEAELASERITGEIGMSPRPAEEGESDGGGGGSATPARPKPRTKVK